MLKEKDKIPTGISLLNDQNVTVKFEELIDGVTVLYFYPKDNTPGCTTEACEFRDFNKDIQKMGVTIIGVSKDSPASHQKFKEKHNLNFLLLSDTEQELMKAFGVWQKKKMMGKEYMGTVRSTFIIDGAGKILKVWPNVKAKGHAFEVFNELKQLI